MAKYADHLRDIARVGSAASDENRLRLLMALQGRSLCVCQMTTLLSLAGSTVSRHLSVLKDAGLVKETKRGRWVYHELCDSDCDCRPVIDWLREQLRCDTVIAQDRVRLKEILAMDPEELCGK
jgi:ArsR family transcriptional regulator